jgi:glycosyltransferase involved in cell wall biosynthesis
MTLGINGWRIHGQRTGVGRYLLNIVRHWDTELVRGRFGRIVFYSPRQVDRAEVPLPANLRERVAGPDCRMLLWENLRFGPLASEDVLFCPSFSRPLVARGRTVVVTFEATLKLYPEYFPRTSWYKSPRAYLTLYEWSARNATLVITGSEQAKRDIVQAYGVPAEKIRVVPLAPLESFQPMPGDPRLPAIRQRYLGADSPFFLFVGKMTPRRNVPRLMEAFALLKRRDSLPHKLLVVGKHMTGFPIHEHARQLGIAGDFAHAEYVSDGDLALLYNAASVFVLPYSYEALSLTAMEAQAAGLPVITMDTPGLREVTGGIAIYIGSVEAEEIAAAMRTMAGDESLRQDLSSRGRTFAAQFSWRRSADETLSVLEEAGRM